MVNVWEGQSQASTGSPDYTAHGTPAEGRTATSRQRHILPLLPAQALSADYEVPAVQGAKWCELRLLFEEYQIGRVVGKAGSSLSTLRKTTGVEVPGA